MNMRILKTILTVFLFTCTGFAYSQVSKIYQLPNGPFSFSKEGKLKNIYEKIEADSGYGHHFLLLTRYDKLIREKSSILKLIH